MKTKAILFSLIFLALTSCKADPVIYRVPGGDDEEEITTGGEESTLLVGTFNIRYYNTSDEYPWSVRKDPVMDFIKDKNPDFLGLQEIRSSQAQDFVYELGDDYGYYDINRDTGSSVSGSSGEGVGILYRKDRFSILDKGFFWLAEPSDKLPDENPDGTFSTWNSACRRVVVWVKATDRYHDDMTVWFFATHFDHKSTDARLNSSNLTVDKLHEITGISDLKGSATPVFLVADFNCTYTSSELTPIKSSMNDARTTASESEPDQRTLNGFGETSNSIIDHIFYGGGVTADKYDVVTDDYGVAYISDHYPILLQCTYE